MLSKRYATIPNLPKGFLKRETCKDHNYLHPEYLLGEIQPNMGERSNHAEDPIYADDSAAGGSIKGLKEWWDRL